LCHWSCDRSEMDYRHVILRPKFKVASFPWSSAFAKGPWTMRWDFWHYLVFTVKSAISHQRTCPRILRSLSETTAPATKIDVSEITTRLKDLRLYRNATVASKITRASFWETLSRRSVSPDPLRSPP
jgi:hypothetical protein